MTVNQSSSQTQKSLGELSAGGVNRKQLNGLLKIGKQNERLKETFMVLHFSYRWLFHCIINDATSRLGKTQEN
jgi:hypothetical protein